MIVLTSLFVSVILVIFLLSFVPATHIQISVMTTMFLWREAQDFYVSHCSLWFVNKSRPSITGRLPHLRPNGTIIYCINTMDRLLGIEGPSKLARFVHKRSFNESQVACMPTVYNEDIIFELPSCKGEGRKGEGLANMDWENDYYSWSHIINMSAKIVNAKHWNITKVNCINSLQCRFEECVSLTRAGIRNIQSWMGRLKV